MTDRHMADARAKPSDLELQVLSVLWRRGPSTARQVLEALPDGKARAYTTALTVLQVMEKKGLLTHTRDAGGSTAHVYKPAVTKRQVLRPLLRGLVDRVFGGSTSAAVQQLLEESDVSADEVAQIRAMLREKQRERGSGGTGTSDD
jgi:BlaI family transcriptional regulator, penicillinase repressor